MKDTNTLWGELRALEDRETTDPHAWNELLAKWPRDSSDREIASERVRAHFLGTKRDDLFQERLEEALLAGWLDRRWIKLHEALLAQPIEVSKHTLEQATRALRSLRDSTEPLRAHLRCEAMDTIIAARDLIDHAHPVLEGAMTTQAWRPTFIDGIEPAPAVTYPPSLWRNNLALFIRDRGEHAKDDGWPHLTLRDVRAPDDKEHVVWPAARIDFGEDTIRWPTPWSIETSKDTLGALRLLRRLDVRTTSLEVHFVFDDPADAPIGHLAKLWEHYRDLSSRLHRIRAEVDHG